ncbi:MAG: 3D domain-containing protein [Moorellaceae bacterium]
MRGRAVTAGLFLILLLVAFPKAVLEDVALVVEAEYNISSSQPVIRPGVTASRQLKYRELVLEITAYTAHDRGMDGKGMTYTGLPVDRGVLAVDPQVIPLGSIVWIPGVGYTVALDTGSAIKGNRADLFMQDRQKALEWGRRMVKVRVLE